MTGSVVRVAGDGGNVEVEGSDEGWIHGGAVEMCSGRGWLAGAAVVVPPMVGGCSALGLGNTLASVRERGTIRAGIAGEVPYSFLDDDGGLTGAVGEVHRLIFERLGVEVEPVEVPFRRLLDDLDAGNFDVVTAGMFITAARCGQATFSEPVYCAPSALLVAAGNPQGLSDYASIAAMGATVAVLGAAVEGTYAEGAGVAADDISRVASQQEGLELVATGEVDALALTGLSLRALLDRTGQDEEADDGPAEESLLGQVEMLAPFVPEVDGEELLGCGGAAFRSTDTELRDAFNTELSAMRESGELQEVLQPWGFTDAEVPPEGVTTEELCETSGLGGESYDLGPR